MSHEEQHAFEDEFVSIIEFNGMMPFYTPRQLVFWIAYDERIKSGIPFSENDKEMIAELARVLRIGQFTNDDEV